MAKGDSWSTETYHATRRETIDRGVTVTHAAEKSSQSGLGP